MFDKYMIVEDTLRSTADGASFGARLPYYRGLGLSMVEEVAVRIDGTSVPLEDVRLTLHGNTYSLSELPGVFDDRWEMGEIATVSVRLASPLKPGSHVIDLHERLRISYMPVPGGGADSKTLTLKPEEIR